MSFALFCVVIFANKCFYTACHELDIRQSIRVKYVSLSSPFKRFVLNDISISQVIVAWEQYYQNNLLFAVYFWRCNEPL